MGFYQRVADGCAKYTRPEVQTRIANAIVNELWYPPRCGPGGCCALQWLIAGAAHLELEASLAFAGPPCWHSRE